LMDSRLCKVIMEPDSSVMGSVTICQQCLEPLYVHR
jgi:hypothetical protein